jgi:antitoxin HicB
MHGYPLIIRPLSAQEGGGFLVEIPDLPGCMADGQTVEEAVHEAESAIESWIKIAEEFNDEIPCPA